MGGNAVSPYEVPIQACGKCRETAGCNYDGPQLENCSKNHGNGRRIRKIAHIVPPGPSEPPLTQREKNNNKWCNFF
jgi:hypothetical protein